MRFIYIYSKKIGQKWQRNGLPLKKWNNNVLMFIFIPKKRQNSAKTFSPEQNFGIREVKIDFLFQKQSKDRVGSGRFAKKYGIKKS